MNERQPIRTKWSRAFGHDDLKELFLQLGGDLSALAGADRDTVNRADRRDLSGSAGEEKLIRKIKCGTLNGRFNYLDAEFAGDLDDRITGDARKDRSSERRRDQLAAIDEEKILTRAFGTYPRSSRAMPSENPPSRASILMSANSYNCTGFGHCRH